jgi:predicted dehydrogenase
MLAGIFPRRFNEATIEFKKAVDAGRLGKITLADAYIKWYRTQEYYDNGDWRGTWKLDGGGALMNQSIHTIDLIYYLNGDVEWVCAFADRSIHKRIETEDNAVAILKFKNGSLGVIEGSTSCFSPLGHPAEVHMCGSDGSIFMRDDSFTVWDFKKKLLSDKRIMKRFRAKAGEKGAGAADPAAISFIGHQKNFEDAVRALRAGKRPLIDGGEARKSIEIILSIYRSALTGGKPVKLPLKRTPVRKSFC